MANQFERIVDPTTAPDTGTVLDAMFHVLRQGEVMSRAAAMQRWDSMSPQERLSLMQTGRELGLNDPDLSRRVVTDLLLLDTAFADAA